MLAAVAGMMTVVGCGAREEALKSGDLVFVVEEPEGVREDGMSSAIIDATGVEGASATHVGIIEVSEGKTYVIDAAPKDGVSVRTMEEFEKEFIQSSKAHLVVMRLTVPFDAEEVIRKAKSMVGKQYDFYFLPDNDSYYCSEFVQLCYSGENGEPIFESKPMNFKDADGNYPEYWEQLFSGLDTPIPQGVPGTNPSDMMQNSNLKKVK